MGCSDGQKGEYANNGSHATSAPTRRRARTRALGVELPSRAGKILIAIALVFMCANIVLAWLAPLGLVRIIASPLALKLGVVYGLFSGALIGTAMYYTFQHHGSQPGIREYKSGIFRWPILAGLFMFVLMAGFGFFAMSHSVASVYTRIFGEPGSQVLTVSGSYWARRWQRCYDHNFRDVPLIARGGRVLCIDRALAPGSRVRLDGHASVLGITVTDIYLENGF